MKKLVLMAALGSMLTAGAVAQANSGLSPRDPPYGKGNAGNDTMHLPSQARTTYASHTAVIPPRDPPYGKGNASNDTMHEPSGAGQSYSTSSDQIPPRDPPYGKGM